MSSAAHTEFLENGNDEGVPSDPDEEPEKAETQQPRPIVKDAEEADDDEEEVEEVGDDQAPDGAEEVEDEALQDEQKLDHDDRRQKAPRVTAA